jgi:hypothetical protein
MARTEFAGNILTIRAVEDCIRASHKYSEGISSRLFSHHPSQGERFPSRVLTKYYEVHPEIDLDQLRDFWDVAFTTSDWLWGDPSMVNVLFRYNYATNRAWAYVYGGEPALLLLKDKIQGLTAALDSIVTPPVHEQDAATIDVPSTITMTRRVQ